MKNKIINHSLGLLTMGVLLWACQSNKANVSIAENVEPIVYPQEKHFKNVKQLTFGGNNAEAYWNFAGDKLVFQSDNKNWGLGCDQIFILDLKKEQDSTNKRFCRQEKAEPPVVSSCRVIAPSFTPVPT